MHSSKKKTRQPKLPRFNSKGRLEGHASANLNLPGCIEEVAAVGIRNTSESGTESEARSYSRAASRRVVSDDVAGIVHAGDILFVDQVEEISRQLQVISLTEGERFTQAHIGFQRVRLAEAIVSENVNTIGAAGTVNGAIHSARRVAAHQ